MVRKVLLRGALLVLILVFLSLAVGYAALKSGQLMPVRQSVVERLLGDAIGQPVRVEGPVEIDLSHAISIRAETVGFVRNDSDGRSSKRTFNSVVLNIPYGALIGSGPKLAGLELSGTRFEFGPGGRKVPADSKSGGALPETPSVLARLPGTLLASGLAENLRLTEIDLHYTDEADGWSETLELDEFSLRKPANDRKIMVVARARLNGRPITLTGGIDGRLDGDNNVRRQLRLELETDGLEAVLDGSLELSSPVVVLDADLYSRSQSLATFLKTIAVTGALDGTAHLKGHLSGPLDALAVSQLDASGDTRGGNRIRINGTVANLSEVAGLDISLMVALAPLPEPPKASQELLRFEITGFDARVQGGQGMFSVEDAHLQTSLAVLNLGNTGPISIDRVVRNEDNSVGLQGIHIRHGPQDGPAFLELTGHIQNAVAISGISFAGDLRVPLSEIVGFTHGGNAVPGTLTGTLAASDHSGSLNLDNLSMTLAGTDLLSLNLDLGIEDIRRISNITLKTRLNVPDFGQLAQALLKDGAARNLPFQFEGDLELEEKALSFRGVATSGASPVRIDLSFGDDQAEDSGAQQAYLLAGSVQSDSLDPSNYAGPVALIGKMRLQNRNKVELHPEALRKIRAALDLDIRKLMTAGKHAGNIKGHLAYADWVATLAPVELEYLDGTIKGDFSADFSVKPARLGAKGRVEKLRLGELLAEIGHPVPFSSTLYLSFDVSAPAVNRSDILKSLSGRISASLWGGSIPTRLLDLSGLNLVRWLTAGNRDGQGRFVCAVLPFSFHDGLASSRTVILETKDVQIVGNGSVNLRSGALDLSFLPRPKVSQMVDIVSPFTISGTMSDPKIKTEQPKSARAAAELVTLPLNLAGHIFSQRKPVQTEKPCRLPKTYGPK